MRAQTPEYQEPSFGWNSHYWQELGAPWGGLFSSAADFAVICQLMLGGARSAACGRRAGHDPRHDRNWLVDLPDVPEVVPARNRGDSAGGSIIAAPTIAGATS